MIIRPLYLLFGLLVLGAAGIYLWLRDPAYRWWLYGALAAILFMWFVVPGLSSKSFFTAGNIAHNSPRAVKGNKVIERIGKAHGKTAAQISLRYLVQQDIVVIPRTSKIERLSENAAIFDFELSSEEMKEIASLAHRRGRVVGYSYSGSPQWD